MIERGTQTRRQKDKATRGDVNRHHYTTYFVFPFELFRSPFTGIREKYSALRTPRVLASVCRAKLYAASTDDSGKQEIESDAVNSQDYPPSSLQKISETMKAQTRGMIGGFRENGLPWKGKQCKSLVVGVSSFFYCAPIFFCENNNIEKCLWLLQAILSVMADYIYIDRDSLVHGVDRYFAMANLSILIIRAACGLKAITMTIAIIPITAFILANESKRQRNLQRWMYYHFLWHLTGSIAVSFVTYLLHNCSDYEEGLSTGNYSLDRFCSKAH